MPLTGEEIRANLTRFAAHWSQYDRSERAEAQTFLNQLFECYGAERQAVARFEEPQAGKFLDLIWPGVCLIEMKAPGEAKRLAKHREQALDYWGEAADHERGIPAPRYVVLCAFQRFEVWQPGDFPGKPRTAFELNELPDQYDALLFLAGAEPVFTGGQAAVTIEAAQQIAELNGRLEERNEGTPEERRQFLLQCVWCMFAEDLGQIPGHRFSHVVKELVANPGRSSADDLGRLFELLDDPSPTRPQTGMFAGTPYANGELFATAARIHLVSEELELLQRACAFQWGQIQPSIFGSLLESVFGHEKQWELGAHYTYESEIQKIVGPTIVEPWSERIEGLGSFQDARRAQDELMRFVVLDPACGSGNFLYVAYRELRRLEARLAERALELARAEGRAAPEGLSAFFSLSNIRGIEIDPFAVQLARVTLWMGHRLAVEELRLSEATLPLADLSGIQQGDALKLPWPRADAIVSNPPYHGSQQLRKVLPDDYVKWLGEAFGCGIKDLCVYWFRRAADQMRPGDRAGMVGTNSISQNRARGASLNYVVEKGGVITDAVSRQKWPGAAVVNVSIVNWGQEPDPPPTRFVLDGDEVIGISTRLRASKLAIEEFEPLRQNAGRSFQGPIPAGSFYLDTEEAQRLLERDDADYSKVVRPYLIGDDITEEPEQGPRRFIIDFALRSLEEAMRYPAALDLVRQRVKPERDNNQRKTYRENWWRFAEPRPGMRAALALLPRYIAGNAQGKRFLFVWSESSVCPSNLTNVFAFEDDYSLGILTSSAHQAWAKAEASTLRVDLRYTPTSCFETFPWPLPDEGQHEAIGSLARALIDRRQAICVERQIGLTDFYNQLDEGAWSEVAELHSDLDAAVAEAYGWTRSVAGAPLEIRARLAELHRRISDGETDYDPFGSGRRGTAA